jgi:hypothetical protein
MSTLQIPLGGILTPLTIPPPAPITLEGFPSTLTFAPGSTEIGVLIPGLLSFGPELAAVITPIPLTEFSSLKTPIRR